MHKQVQAQAKLCKSPHLTKSTVVKRRAPRQQESKRTRMFYNLLGLFSSLMDKSAKTQKNTKKKHKKFPRQIYVLI